MQKLSLDALAREQLAAARQAGGRSAHTVYGGHERILRQTMVALIAGGRMADHESPGEATLQVLRGRIRLHTAGAEWDGRAGDLLIIPEERHGVTAVEDAIFLLTVAKRSTDAR